MEAWAGVWDDVRWARRQDLANPVSELGGELWSSPKLDAIKKNCAGSLVMNWSGNSIEKEPPNIDDMFLRIISK